jgi:hypothetical protein
MPRITKERKKEKKEKKKHESPTVKGTRFERLSTSGEISH